MIRETHKANPAGTIVAYSDNAAILEGTSIRRFMPQTDGSYIWREDMTHFSGQGRDA
jgi:phosphoribosylformylglycinamidine synthase